MTAQSAPQQRYRRTSRIATGGMGEVWRGHDEVLGREVAIKYLKPELAGDTGSRARFASEARTAAGVHHPNVASVFDVSTDQDSPYLVMELVEGEPLSDLSRQQPVDPETARDLVRQAAEGLAAAHARGIVHRDLKPGNLLVTPDRIVKITDFGIARTRDAAPLTQTGEVIGTPRYLSPEQAAGESATAASDVYSLGVVLYELLAGRPPFVADSPVAAALAHLRADPPPLPEGVPEDLRAVVNRALAKDPAMRFADASAFAAALQPQATSNPIDPAGSTRTQVLSIPADDSELSDEPKRTSTWLPLAIALGLVALVLLVWLITKLVGGGGRTTATIDPATYVGKPKAAALSALHRSGFRHVNTHQTSNPDGHRAGTVARISPVGSQPVSKTVTLTVWGATPVHRTPAPSVSTAPTNTATPTPAPATSSAPQPAPPKAKGEGHGPKPEHGHGHGSDKPSKSHGKGKK